MSGNSQQHDKSCVSAPHNNAAKADNQHTTTLQMEWMAPAHGI